MIGSLEFAPSVPLARSILTQETAMNPSRIPGNEPDPGDMSTERGPGAPSEKPIEHGLPDDDAEKLGDFA